MDYCSKNNLKLLIWDDDIIKNESVFSQFMICNNAEIIVGFGGSFQIFNHTMNSGKILILGSMTEYDGKYIPLYNMTFYSFTNHIFNSRIKDIYIHFYDNDQHIYDKILLNFLETI